MSVKCGNSNTFYPVLLAEYNADNSEDKSEFKEFVSEYFNDPKSIFRDFLSGEDKKPAQKSEIKWGPELVSSRSGLEVVEDAKSPAQFFVGDANRQTKVERNFAKRIVESSVFDGEQFIDAKSKTEDGVDLLNKNLFNYKLELLDIIAAAIEKSIDLNSIDPSQYISVYNEILGEFKTQYDKSDKTNPKFKEAFDAYVTLTMFDQLLKNNAPYIKVDPRYRTNPLSQFKYIYDGPHTEHYTGYFSANEQSSAKDSASDLCKILLDYFPQVNNKGVDIPNSKIGFDSFASIMCRFKNWVQNSDDIEVQKE